MNRASFLIQELLGLAEKSAETDVSLAPKQKANNDDREQVGTTTSGRQRKRRRQDADSVGEEIRSYESEGETLQGVKDVPSASATSIPKATKRLRTTFRSSQLRILEYAFYTCPYPDSYRREQIARATGIDEAKIQVWFQNRRARYRKRQPLERQRHHAAARHGPVPQPSPNLFHMPRDQQLPPQMFSSCYPPQSGYNHPPCPSLPSHPCPQSTCTEEATCTEPSTCTEPTTPEDLLQEVVKYRAQTQLNRAF